MSPRSLPAIRLEPSGAISTVVTGSRSPLSLSTLTPSSARQRPTLPSRPAVKTRAPSGDAAMTVDRSQGRGAAPQLRATVGVPSREFARPTARVEAWEPTGAGIESTAFERERWTEANRQSLFGVRAHLSREGPTSSHSPASSVKSNTRPSKRATANIDPSGANATSRTLSSSSASCRLQPALPEASRLPRMSVLGLRSTLDVRAIAPTANRDPSPVTSNPILESGESSIRSRSAPFTASKRQTEPSSPLVQITSLGPVASP